MTPQYFYGFPSLYLLTFGCLHQVAFLLAGRTLHAHPAGTNIALLSRVCVCVCVCVCVLHHSGNYYATIATSIVEATGSLQAHYRPIKVHQARLVLCCLDGERVVGITTIILFWQVLIANC